MNTETHLLELEWHLKILKFMDLIPAIHAEINTSDNYFDTWISVESDIQNKSGNLMDTCQSSIVTWSIPPELGNSNDRLVHLHITQLLM